MTPRARTIAVVLALVALPSTAQAEDGPTEDPSDASSEEAPRPHAFEFAARTAARGEILRVYDVSLYMGGAEASFGAEGRVHSIYGTVEVLVGRTTEGLFATDVALTATYEAHFSGFRLALGGGPMDLVIQRATRGGALSSIGVRGVARAAYDFAPRRAPFVALQADVEALNPSLVAWGVGAALGWRF